MNLFRNLLFWIVLALAGALLAQLLLQDPGYVLVRYGGNDYTTNVPKASPGAGRRRGGLGVVEGPEPAVRATAPASQASRLARA